jgi:putative mRNA 3-end processing factor
MIDPGFIIENENGLYCTAGDFYLDPQKPVSKAVISHAHGDHAVGGNHTIYCTPATAAIMRLRLHKNAGSVFLETDYKNQFLINNVCISFIPAGHILGSAQVLMEYNGVRYLYTGDYKIQADSTCEPVEVVNADVLITESTFADPTILHPDPVTEVCKLNENAHNVLLGAYTLGKAQRITSLLSKHCAARKILIHHSILPLHKLYERFGFNVGHYEPYNRKLMKEPGRGYVYIVPPMTFNHYFRARNVIRVFASGWQRLHYQNDMELLISDHVDWNDILKMVSEVKPKEIWTVHGNGDSLKEYFEDRIPVKSLGKC